MFLLKRPTQKQLDSFLSQQDSVGFSYAETGATKSSIPAGYQIDQNRIKLGEGSDCFDRAKAALDRWAMFQTAYTQPYPIRKPQTDQLVVIVIKHLGFYSLNPSRVVYLRESDSQEQIDYGFAYGTLKTHAEKGEERFLVTFNKLTEEVHYDLFAFSKPNHWLVRFGNLYARHLQKTFARASLIAMREAVKR